MKLSDINIRDPFILPEDGKYYMYGTRAKNFGVKTGGFDVYTSTDLEDWSEPIECFDSAKYCLNHHANWAPEVHKYNGAYYMFATFTSEATNERGTYILKADNPLGPFAPHSEGSVTPADWSSLDGTFYVSKDGKPFMIFCHEWTQIDDGEVCSIELTPDLKSVVGVPETLFKGSDMIGAKPIKENCFVTDGPFLYRTNEGNLLMIWSSFGEGGYTEALAYSDNGEIDGKWKQSEKHLFTEDGGHGMIFTDFNGELKFIMHQPNKPSFERPRIIKIKDTGNLIEVLK